MYCVEICLVNDNEAQCLSMACPEKGGPEVGGVGKVRVYKYLSDNPSILTIY